MRRIFVSQVADALLSERQNDFKWAVVEHIQKLGFQPEIFYNPRSVDGISARKAWTPADAEDVIRRCVGGVIIGMPRWRHFDKSGADVWMATEYAQYEGAMLRVAALPLLILLQDNIKPRGVFENSFGQHVRRFPADADRSWLTSVDFDHSLKIWLANIRDRRDIFLGYCSSSAAAAAKVRNYVESELGLTVWIGSVTSRSHELFSRKLPKLHVCAVAAYSCSPVTTPMPTLSHGRSGRSPPADRSIPNSRSLATMSSSRRDSSSA